MRHLISKKHGTTKESPRQPSAEQNQGKGSEVQAIPEAAESVQELRPQVRTQQLKVESFLATKLSLKEDMLRLICESNLSLNQSVQSKAVRRVLTRAYPTTDPAPPRSRATLKRQLAEEASKVSNELRHKFGGIRSKGLSKILERALMRIFGAIPISRYFVFMPSSTPIFRFHAFFYTDISFS